jgi:nucleoside-diphosphate-sugar epimerase
VEEGGSRTAPGAGDTPARQPTPTVPHTLYGAAKHAVHLVAECYAEQVGVELAWGRIFYVYGPHEHPARLASSVARALVRGERVKCTDGAQVRDYIYVSELGEAFAALLDSRVAGPVNMASGQAVRIADLVTALAAAAGRPELVQLSALPRRPGDPERLTADVRRLREEVGWSASVGVQEGAARTVGWWGRGWAGSGYMRDAPLGPGKCTGGVRI